MSTLPPQHFFSNITSPLRVAPVAVGPRSSHASPPSPFPPRHKRKRSKLFVFVLATFLLPIALTFIPIHDTIVSTIPYEGSYCSGADTFPNTPTTCRTWDDKATCCPLPSPMSSTQRCWVGGGSCYKPLLGTGWVVLMDVVVVLLWCCVACYASKPVSQLCGCVEQEEEETAWRTGVGGDASRYQRMDEVVEMR